LWVWLKVRWNVEEKKKKKKKNIGREDIHDFFFYLGLRRRISFAFMVFFTLSASSSKDTFQLSIHQPIIIIIIHLFFFSYLSYILSFFFKSFPRSHITSHYYIYKTLLYFLYMYMYLLLLITIHIFTRHTYISIYIYLHIYLSFLKKYYNIKGHIIKFNSK